jgi:hypothetical protein
MTEIITKDQGGEYDPIVENITKVAEDIIQSVDAPESVPYDISFAQYNRKECLLDEIKKENAKRTLKILRDIGVYFTDEFNFSKNTDPDIQIRAVHNNGGYTDLFRGLDQQFHDSVREIVCDKHDYASRSEIKLRIFYTTLENANKFYVIAIRDNAHYDTDKSGR